MLTFFFFFFFFFFLMIRQPPRSTRETTPFPTRRSSDLVEDDLLQLLGIAHHGGQVVRHRDDGGQIGRAHVRTPVTVSHLVCRLLLEKKKCRLLNEKQKKKDSQHIN